MSVRASIYDLAPALQQAWFKYFLLIVSILCVGSYSYVYWKDPYIVPIRADGIGYYAYLPAVFIHQDISMEKLGQGGDLPSWTGIQRFPETGRYLDKYPIGIAVLISPFFVIADGLTRVFGYPRDGFSFCYQAAAGVAGSFYLLLGLYHLKKHLLKTFSPTATILALSAILFGTNLFHYSVHDSMFSHVFSFSLFAIFIQIMDRWNENPSWKLSVWLGILGALIILVRIPNLLFVATFFLLSGISQPLHAGARIKYLFRHSKEVLIFLGVMTVVVFPQLGYWKFASGHWLVNSYQNEGFHFASPQIFEVLFSVRRGVFVWCPILLFVLPGIFLLRRIPGSLFLPAVAFLLIHLYVIASWHMWHFGGGFGHRAFVESYAVLVFPLAAFYDRAKGTPFIHRSVLVLSVAMIGISLVQTLQFWNRIIPIHGFATWKTYRAAYLNFKSIDEYQKQGFQLFENRKYTEAIEQLEIVAELARQNGILDQSYDQTFYAIGLAYGFQENFRKALQNFEEAIRLNPDFTQAHQNRVLVLEALGDQSNAILACREWIQHASSSSNAQHTLPAAQSLLKKLQQKSGSIR